MGIEADIEALNAPGAEFVLVGRFSLTFSKPEPCTHEGQRSPKQPKEATISAV